MNVFEHLPVEPDPDLRAFAARVVKAPEVARQVHLAGLGRVESVPGGLRQGLNLFGSIASDHIADFLLNITIVEPVSVVALPGGVLFPRSAVVCSPEHGVYRPSLATGDPAADFAHVAAFDPSFRALESGGAALTFEPAALPIEDAVAMPVCGAGVQNYGHYLFDGLGMALLAAGLVPQLRLVGPPLYPWQAEMLSLFGLLERYEEQLAPKRYRSLIASTTLNGQTGAPSRYARPVFDTLRARIGSAMAQPFRRVLLSRAGAAKRPLLNRDAVERALKERGFEIVDPSALSVAQQVQLAAESEFIIGESGAAMGNVGFCEPGTAVLEIQPTNFPDQFVRSTCRVAGAVWHVFYGAAEPTAEAPDAFSVRVDELLGAVDRILSLRSDYLSPPGALEAPPWFDEALYLRQNPDIAAAGVHAWDHLIRSGRREARRLRPPEG